MARPIDLPDYGTPPLAEVVLGVHFRTPDQYQQILAGEIRELFRERFPLVEDHQRLPPQFETFGPPTPNMAKFELLQSAQHDRFWFLAPDGSELVQFQEDRLLHNWRRPPNEGQEYPRFDTMAETFLSYSLKLEQYFASLSGESELEITQVELSYINHFYVEPDNDLTSLSDYIRLLSVPSNEAEDMGFRYRRTIYDDDGGPTGRIYVSGDPAVSKSGEKISTLNIVVRGAPKETTLDSAMHYLKCGRELIVNEFTDITTDKAQARWERIK